MLQKQAIPINFSKGVEQRTDPFQVPAGNFIELKNSVFDTVQRLTKRNGFGELPALPEDLGKYITTYSGNLTALSDSLYAFSDPSNSWVNKGSFLPVQIETSTLVRNNTNQSFADTAIAPNGLACTAFTDNVPGPTPIVYKYTITDATTSQTVVNVTPIPLSAGTQATAARVFTVGDYFILLFLNSTGAAFQYIAINSNTLVVSSEVTIDPTVSGGSGGFYDATLVDDTLYIAWADSGPGVVHYTSLSSTLVLGATQTVTYTPTTNWKLSVCADVSGVSPVIYVSSYSSGGLGRVFAFDDTLAIVLASTQWIDTFVFGGVALTALTSTATAGVVTIFYQQHPFYSVGSSVLFTSDYISKITVTVSGTVGTPSIICRSVGLSSKAVLYNGVSYFLTLHISSLQPTYFLIDSSGTIISKIAYQNGGSSYYDGYLSLMSIDDGVIKTPYLVKSLIQAANKAQGAATVNNIYSQTGINLLSCDLNTDQISSVEVAKNLNINGGLLYNYDGAQVVENGFNLFPEIITSTTGVAGGMDRQQYYYVATYEWSDNQGNLNRSAGSLPQSALTSGAGTPFNFTGDIVAGSSTITGVSSFTDLYIGMLISGTGLVAGTYITALSVTNNTVTVSTPSTSSGLGVSYSLTTGIGNVVYIPTLQLTRKVANPIKIVIYRWSTANQTYYQITSILEPTLNDQSVDYITYIDTIGDAAIVGNNILYTTGGVVENIAPPPSVDVALFNSRLFLIDAEEDGVLWFSKQVIPSVPVEMSDLFTVYVPPVLGGEVSSGKTKALYTLDDKLIIFKENAMYYLAGIGPDNTGANSQFGEVTLINSAVGCIDKRSIVLIPEGLMFQSNKGIWLLARNLQTLYIGAAVQTFTQDNRVISATSIPETNQVRFLLDNDTMLLYDYSVNQWGSFDNTPGVSTTLYLNRHTYITADGRVLTETPGEYLDGTDPVLMSFKTNWMNFAGLQGFERFYQMLLLGEYKTPFTLDVSLAYDYDPTVAQTITVTPDTEYVFEARVFPERQKCESFQLIVQEQYDPSVGPAAGEGLTLSGVNLVVGLKKGYRVSSAKRSFG